MHEVLVVYSEVNLSNENGDRSHNIITVSVDEKPGIQAIKNVVQDLCPVPGRYPQMQRMSTRGSEQSHSWQPWISMTAM
jgi:hypothetical protein